MTLSPPTPVTGVSVEVHDPEKQTGWFIRGAGWTMEPLGNILEDEKKRVCGLAALALSGGTDDRPTELWVAFNRELVKHFAPSTNFSINEIIVACGTVMSVYLNGLPDKIREEKVQEVTKLLAEMTSGAPLVPEPTAGGQTADEVRALSRRSIRVELMGPGLSWMEREEREFLGDLLLSIVPEFEAQIHTSRVEKRDPRALRVAGTVLLSTMLSSLVKNTTADKAARQSVLHRIHKDILGHLKGAEGL